MFFSSHKFTCSDNVVSYFLFLLKDGALLQRALSFYRLVIIWLVDLVGGFKMPLPSTCPMEFACIPEHFVDDAMDLLILTSRIPKALEGFVLVSHNFALNFNKISLFAIEFYQKIHIMLIPCQDDFLNFIIMFMASPSYIKNPYLRAKMVEVLNCWMQQRRLINVQLIRC